MRLTKSEEDKRRVAQEYRESALRLADANDAYVAAVRRKAEAEREFAIKAQYRKAVGA